MAESDGVGPTFVPIHRAGWPFVGIFVVITLILAWLWLPLFGIGLILTGWCAYFFRDPNRTTPDDQTIVVSPADGVIQSLKARVPPPELEMGDEPRPCVSVFMNVFDVHVNRTPVPGEIVRKAYHAGKFLNASFDKASDENERQSYRMQTEQGHQVALVQIAGLVARRILSFVHEGQSVEAGERVGLIRFGSRCDVYLPEDVVPKVIIGQRAVAGETVLAHLTGEQVEPKGRTS